MTGAAALEGTLTPRLELKGITKRFPGVLANDHVSFSVLPGEIHALLGENGAGKSTLVKMIYGIMQPDAGEISWNGQRITVDQPQGGAQAGHRHGVPAFLAVRGDDRAGKHRAWAWTPAFRRATLRRKVVAVMAQYGLKLEPHRIVSTLSVGERQRIEIVRALLLNPKLLIMDEPTSVLTPQEVEQLFVVLRQLAAEGCSILYISHKLHEIKALCDTATILRGGKLVDTCDPEVETSRSMAEKMIGGNLKDIQRGASREFGAEKLVVRGLNVPKDGPFGMALKDIGFAVRAGEIFGIAGRGGQRAERAADGAVGRNSGAGSCGDQGRRRRDRQPVGQGAAVLRHGLGSRRAQRPCGGARFHADRQRHPDRRATGWAWCAAA